MNPSGVFNAFRLLKTPTLCLPHHTISTFDELPALLSSLRNETGARRAPDIRALVLDKDNCFAAPRQSHVWPAYEKAFAALRKEFTGSSMVIVSNTAGSSSDASGEEAEELERNTGVKVMHHRTKKPGCAQEVLERLRSSEDVHISSPSQIAVVGDRLMTDIMMANLMGATGIYVRRGVVGQHSFLARLESKLASGLLSMGYTPPDPKSDFE